MKLTELFNKYDIPQSKHLLIAFLLASYQLLKYENEDEDVHEIVDAYNLHIYELDKLYISEYNLISGAYHNGIWFSFENIIKTIVDFYESYDED